MTRLALVALFLSSVCNAQEAGSGYLGVMVARLGETDHTAPKGVTSGVVLTHVEEGSAAHKAGLRIGDVVVFFDGKAVATIDELVARVAKRKAGDKVTYKVHRGTGSIEGTLRLGKRPPPEEELIEKAADEAGARKMPRPDKGNDIDKRLDRVADQIEDMRRKLTGEKAKPRKKAPGNLIGWIEREEVRRRGGPEEGRPKKPCGSTRFG